MRCVVCPAVAGEVCNETLREALRDYLALRRSLGYKMVTQDGCCRASSTSSRSIRRRTSARLALQWAQGDVQRASGRAACVFVRGFARCRSAVDALTEIPPVRLLPYRSTRAKPYLYSDDEVRRLLEAALQLPTNWPSTLLRPMVFHCLFGLLSVAGLPDLQRH